ncbi:MAG: response regulator [Anaerolineales bacterium]|jgi:two-component system NarL family response regulator
MRVLVVDDHILFRQGLVSLLQSEPDFEVVGQAGTLTEAIELAQELQPEMILMDFELPDGTGAEATQPILDANPECKIIFLTIYSSDEKLFEAIRSGAVGYLLKSIPINKLLAALRSVDAGEAAISRTMMRRVLVELSKSQLPDAHTPDLISLLTPRELDILRQLLTGASNKEIGARLYISENTVKHHVHSILEKLEVSNRHQAIQYAQEHGFM